MNIVGISSSSYIIMKIFWEKVASINVSRRAFPFLIILLRLDKNKLTLKQYSRRFFMNFIMKISQLGEKQMTHIVCNKIKYCGVVLKNEF